MVDLAFSAEQNALRSAFAELFAKHASIERVRAAEPLGFDERLWAEMVAIGAPVLGVPESAGGAGASALEVAIVAQEFGRRIAPVPLVEAIVAANLLAAVGGQADLVGAIAGGDVLPSLALSRPHDGVVHLAPAGAVADAIVAFDGDRLLLSRRSGNRPYVPQTPNLASAPIADWDLGSDPVVLATGRAAEEHYAAAIAQWRLYTAAALVGLGQTALDIGVDYVKERHAFGVPLGWFQSIQHRLADVATAGEGSELLTWEAAWATDAQPERAPALATMAFLCAAEAAFDICRASLQYHGGYGYTLEYDIQLYFRRAKAWPLAGGALKPIYDELADVLYVKGTEVA